MRLCEKPLLVVLVKSPFALHLPLRGAGYGSRRQLHTPTAWGLPPPSERTAVVSPAQWLTSAPTIAPAATKRAAHHAEVASFAGAAGAAGDGAVTAAVGALPFFFALAGISAAGSAASRTPAALVFCLLLDPTRAGGQSGTPPPAAAAACGGAAAAAGPRDPSALFMLSMRASLPAWRPQRPHLSFASSAAIRSSSSRCTAQQNNRAAGSCNQPTLAIRLAAARSSGTLGGGRRQYVVGGHRVPARCLQCPGSWALRQRKMPRHHSVRRRPGLDSALSKAGMRGGGNTCRREEGMPRHRCPTHSLGRRWIPTRPAQTRRSAPRVFPPRGRALCPPPAVKRGGIIRANCARGKHADCSPLQRLPFSWARWLGLCRPRFYRGLCRCRGRRSFACRLNHKIT